MKEKLKGRKGITLIALVITLIVLLILAGVSIAMLTGENGILTQATSAKEKTEKAGIIERAQTDLLGQQVKTTDGQVTKPMLKAVLDTYFSDVPEADAIELSTELTSKEGNYKIQVSEIYNGTFGTGEKPTGGISSSEIANAADKSEYYGAIVNGYELPSGTNTDVKWKIFYADESNIYLIADNYVEKVNLPNSTTEAGVTIEGANHKPNDGNSSYPRAAYFSNILGDYAGSARITDRKLKALNNSYFNENNFTSTNNNMKSVAYMMDTNAWNSKFKDVNNKAEYVIGGPTVEMLMKSYSQKHGVDYQARAENATGYKISNDGGTSWEYYYSGMLDTSDSLYVISSQSDAYGMWVASPSATNASNVMYVNCGGLVNASYCYYDNIGFRPLVSLKSDVQLQKNEDGTYTIL